MTSFTDIEWTIPNVKAAVLQHWDKLAAVQGLRKCRYRYGEIDVACAIGVCISDETGAELERQNLTGAAVNHSLVQHIFGLGDADDELLEFLNRLQSTHDWACSPYNSVVREIYLAALRN